MSKRGFDYRYPHILDRENAEVMLCISGDKSVDSVHKGQKIWLNHVKVVLYIHNYELFCICMNTTRETGKMGEDIACLWMEKRGFLVIERNYLKKWGEIDIVTAKDNILHFIEVKSIITRLKSTQNYHRPEENVHELKVRRLRRIIQSYLLDRKYGLEAEFKFHVVLVFMNKDTRRARVRFMENIIL